MIAFALLAITAALVLMPLLPAFAEWRTKQDATPLNIVRTHDRNVNAFAMSFRAYILDQIGSRYTVDLAHEDNATELTAVIKRNEHAIASTHPIHLPNDFTFEHEIYGGVDIHGGRKNKFRALLAERNLFLRHNSAVVRWAHAKRVYVGRRCTLTGRVSADADIVIGIGSTFRRLHAPRIIFSPRAGRAMPASASPVLPAPLIEPMEHPARTLIRGDMQIPAASTFFGNVSAQGSLQVGSAAYVRGSIKSDGHLTIAANALIDGAVICGGDLTIGSACKIRGPILAEGKIFVGQGCRVGLPDAQTTVSAPIILVSEDVQVSGSVWAREKGAVLRCGQSA